MANFVSKLVAMEKKERKGKERHKQSPKRYISPICGEASCERIFTKFCTSGDMLKIIICANFGVKKLRGLENTRGQILNFFIEMAGHPYNRYIYRAACDVMFARVLTLAPVVLSCLSLSQRSSLRRQADLMTQL